jgi:hypothetical protein
MQNKAKVDEERMVIKGKDIVRLEYKEPDACEWGRFAPSVALEYDKTNKFLLEVSSIDRAPEWYHLLNISV